jgi:antitoxin (DNA-binding transcriptional repressor) of toxin-antitoxin stability system
MRSQTVTLDDIKASFDKYIALVREGTEVIIMDGDEVVAHMSPPGSGKRVLGLHAHLGKAWMSDDFDDPLPDKFWLGGA